jgi:hypothetical protein
VEAATKLVIMKKPLVLARLVNGHTALMSPETATVFVGIPYDDNQGPDDDHAHQRIMFVATETCVPWHLTEEVLFCGSVIDGETTCMTAWRHLSTELRKNGHDTQSALDAMQVVKAEITRPVPSEASNAGQEKAL